MRSLGMDDLTGAGARFIDYVVAPGYMPQPL
jgi:hypothetical protein